MGVPHTPFPVAIHIPSGRYIRGGVFCLKMLSSLIIAGKFSFNRLK